MRRRFSLFTALVVLILAGASAAIALTSGVRWWTPVPLEGPIADAGWVGRTRAWFTARGFYPPESDAAGHSFSWTRAHAEITVPEIDRVAWFGLEAARPKLVAAQTAFLDRLRELVERG